MSTVSASTNPPARSMQPAWRWLGWIAAVALCLAVLGLYMEPAFMVMLADQMWACF